MSDLLVERHEGVLLLTMNRPERLNALSPAMVDGFLSAFAEAGRDDAVGAVVLTGAGRAFCAGADLAPRSNGAGPEPPRQARLDPVGWPGRVVLGLRAIEKPVIAAVNGVAAGGGFGLMTACHLRLASTEARFSTVFIRRGLAPDFGSSYFLPRIIGATRATEWFLNGDILDAAAGERVGLVSRVLPPERLLKESLALAARLAAGPPLATQLTLRALAGSSENDLEAQLTLEWTGQRACTASEDAREGIRAWQEKREPVWKGR